MQNSNDHFEWGEPISTYSDADAIEDGVLVPITAKDRATRSVFDFLASHTPMGSQPPANWPVMRGWFRAEAIRREQALKLIPELGKDGAQAKFTEMIRERKALAMAKGLIGREERTARRIYENNEGGGIHKLYAAVVVGEILGLLPKPGLGADDKTLWLIPNELGGITLMFPEDY